MEARLHGRQHLIDGGLSRVDPAGGTGAPTRFEEKGARCFVREKHVDAAEALARLHFLVHKMPTLVVFSRGGPSPRSSRVACGDPFAPRRSAASFFFNRGGPSPRSSRVACGDPFAPRRSAASFFFNRGGPSPRSSCVACGDPFAPRRS